MNDDLNSKDQFFLRLVCGLSTIYLLNRNRVQELIDISFQKQQWLRVRNTGSLRVESAQTELPRTIPHSAFPDEIFNPLL